MYEGNEPVISKTGFPLLLENERIISSPGKVMEFKFINVCL